ncbi:iron (metal) dependent repressor, DtxR family [Methanobacterium lacus]|jgi:DtxR family transcriptional regulator, Mn-dependent transcriptional regulator|uniref:Iron (Metal) dependent repressor, DtxR family n=1 Tax=Methanobacterium lacus (strain AL-21) TaxID=877455 RepID=F0TCK0_METLA|nr:metal-dependent transcriptional regulator [Methanobacterium lacus]ADZ09277.1 iron (metal) dependent repressor, DtxR family [Methanobacterium lacus]
MSENKKLSANIEEYLETIYKLSQKDEDVKTSKISKDLGITQASVSEMLKKLDKLEYVKYSQYKGVRLTDKGLKTAQKVTRKHRLLERFLHDILKLKDNLLHDQACEMEHSLSDEAERAMCQVLEYPDKCPGDSVIPACDLKFTSCDECMNRREEEVNEVGKRNENLIPIMDLKDHQKGKVSFIRGDYKVIRRLLDMGITIGAFISVVKIAPLSGPVEVAIRGSKLAIGRDIACNVFVELVE